MWVALSSICEGRGFVRAATGKLSCSSHGGSPSSSRMHIVRLPRSNGWCHVRTAQFRSEDAPSSQTDYKDSSSVSRVEAGRAKWQSGVFEAGLIVVRDAAEKHPKRRERFAAPRVVRRATAAKQATLSRSTALDLSRHGFPSIRSSPRAAWSLRNYVQATAGGLYAGAAHVQSIARPLVIDEGCFPSCRYHVGALRMSSRILLDGRHEGNGDTVLVHATS